MKYLLPLLMLIASCSGDCNKAYNPKSKDYPCGTRAHACSTNPLMCCWNTEVCGGQVGTGCQPGFCCYVGDDYGVVPDAAPATIVKQQPQWSVGTR